MICIYLNIVIHILEKNKKDSENLLIQCIHFFKANFVILCPF